MSIERDVFEWRRFAHWDSSAAKARLSAFALWEARINGRAGELAGRCQHRGADAGLGLIEGFRRESAVALELIVKAVIAAKLRARALTLRVRACRRRTTCRNYGKWRLLRRWMTTMCIAFIL